MLAINATLMISLAAFGLKELLTNGPLVYLIYAVFLLSLVLRMTYSYIRGGFPVASVLCAFILYTASALNVPISFMPLLYFFAQLFEDVLGLKYEHLSRSLRHTNNVSYFAIGIVFYLVAFTLRDGVVSIACLVFSFFCLLGVVTGDISRRLPTR